MCSKGVIPEDGRTYAVMKDAIESMAEFQRGKYSLFSPLPEEKLQRERAEREKAKKAEKDEYGSPVREKEPAGELETAARALAKKQKGNGADRRIPQNGSGRGISCKSGNGQKDACRILQGNTSRPG